MPSEFDQIVYKVRPLWEKQIWGKYTRPGRHFALSLENMILMLLLYYRTYTTQLFVGFWFGIDDSRVCRIIQKLEPLLARVMVLPKRKELSKKEAESLLIDATEQPIERPKKRQRPYYSGEKKRHTLKTEIRTTLQGCIRHVSKDYPGSFHDFNVHKQEPPLHPKERAFVDSGYQGLDKQHRETILPYKVTKTRPLDPVKRRGNRALSRIRVLVENIIGDIKTFKILSDRYRNKRKRHNIKFKIIAGIVNLKNGFATI